MCGFDIECLVETAHAPDRVAAPDEVAQLCILCHRAYDLGLMTDNEIREASADVAAGRRPPYAGKLEALQAKWRSREPQWSRLHKGAQKKGELTLKRRAAARRTAKTRRSRLTPTD